MDYDDKHFNKEKVNVLPARPFFYRIANLLLFFSILSTIFYIGINLLLKQDREFQQPIKAIVKLINMINKRNILVFAFALLVLFIFLKLTKAKKVNFDKWVIKIANRRLSSEHIWYTTRALLIDYDITLKPKDLVDFVDELSNKSERFTYYYNSVPNIDQGTVYIVPTKKQPIPKRAELNTKEDTHWNIIPLGEAENHDLKKISPIAWWLNDEEKREDVLRTVPSSHILISGGTGSGKSVLQNCIIGHVTRHADHFQLFLLDIKKVEFGPLRTLAGVKKVGIELDEIEDIIRSVRQIMLDRFRMMEKAEVNNIYKLKNTEAESIIINGKEYQEDEIFNCRVDGEEKLMTARQIAAEFKNPSPKVDKDESRRGFNRVF